jgi:hypothetical protein
MSEYQEVNRHSRESAGLFGEIISAMITSLDLTGINLKSSCADLIRASTSLFRTLEGVDGRDRPGQDEISGSICSVIRPQDFPRTVLRESGNPGCQGHCGCPLFMPEPAPLLSPGAGSGMNWGGRLWTLAFARVTIPS